MERTGVVTMKGKPVTLVGPELKAGDLAPDFTLVGNDMGPVTLSQFKGRKLVIAAVPSLDTPVCDVETRRFNAEAANLGPDVAILAVSMDLPFAQRRWCGAAGIDRVTTASDHREARFGSAYGVLMKESRLLARSVFLVSPDGRIVYVQVVPEVGSEPEYGPVLEAVKSL